MIYVQISNLSVIMYKKIKTRSSSGGDMYSAFKKILIVIVAAGLCVFCGCQDFVAEGNPMHTPTPADPDRIPRGIPPSPVPEETPSLSPSPATVTPVPTPTPEPYTDIVIGGAGDIMGHIQQIEDAYLAGDEEGYSFYHWFDYIKDALSYPDLMIANLEGPIAGQDAGYNGYPMFNFPDEIAPAIKDAGIDVVLSGNNHIMDKGIAGIGRTVDVLEDSGVYHTGAWKSPEERQVPLVIDVNGIKVGVVSATYSLNGFEQHIEPEVLSYLVCSIEEEQVKTEIDLCRKHGAEVIVVCPHMGDEFQNFPRRGIRNFAESYIAMGADIVFASHPHVLQPVTYHTAQLEDGTSRTGIIFYSLGNFISSMYTTEKEAGGHSVCEDTQGQRDGGYLHHQCRIPAHVGDEKKVGDVFIPHTAGRAEPRLPGYDRGPGPQQGHLLQARGRVGVDA